MPGFAGRRLVRRHERASPLIDTGDHESFRLPHPDVAFALEQLSNAAKSSNGALTIMVAFSESHADEKFIGRSVMTGLDDAGWERAGALAGLGVENKVEVELALSALILVMQTAGRQSCKYHHCLSEGLIRFSSLSMFQWLILTATEQKS